MSAIEIIRNIIPEEIFNFTQITSALQSYKKPRDAISNLLRNGQIIRIRKGLYVFNEIWRRKSVNIELLANLIYGPSLISLDYILSNAGLIPENVPEITSITTGRSHSFDTSLGRFSYKQISRNRYIIGSELIQTDNGNYFSAQPLKALADKIWFDKRFLPSSPSSYEEYLFHDLRIDEHLLREYLTAENVDQLDHAYASRKITWFILYLKRKYNLK